MQPFYFRGKRPNVGDEFNSSFWPAVWPQLEAENRWQWLVGIGTILDDRLDTLPGRKLVLGSGLRQGGRRPSPEHTDIRFVRGRLTADALQLPASLAVGDPGFLASRFFPHARDVVPGKVGFVPHYHTESRTWLPRFLSAHPLQLITPTLSPPEFFAALTQCEYVFCEAMHGAIFAEAFGVPWSRVTLHVHRAEGQEVNDFKWRDTFSIFSNGEQRVSGPIFDVRARSRRGVVPALWSAWRAGRQLTHLARVKPSPVFSSSAADLKDVQDRLLASIQAARV